MKQLDPNSQKDLMKLIEEVLSFHRLYKPQQQPIQSPIQNEQTLTEKNKEELTKKFLEQTENENDKLRKEIDKLKQEQMALNLHNMQLQENVKTLEKEKEEIINSNSTHNTSDSDINRIVQKNLANEKENMIQLKMQQELEAKDLAISKFKKQVEELSKSSQENKKIERRN